MSRIAEYIERVEHGLECANTGKTKLTEAQLYPAFGGMSSNMNRIILNEVVKDNDRYLEVGVYRGSTFVCSLFGNNPHSAIAIDNFSQFNDQLEDNKSVFIANVKKHVPQLLSKIALIDRNCFDLLTEHRIRIPANINVYFYDGGHEALEQEAAVTYYDGTLADEFIYIVDDWNYEPARVGTRQAFAKLGTIVHREWEFFTNFNGDNGSWWNGFYIAVCEKRKTT